jgi:hypothetical protein
VRLQYLEANEMFERIFQNNLRHVFEQFAPAIIRALPHLPSHEVFLRALFTMGAFAQMLVGGRAMQVITQGRFLAPSPEAALNSLIQFAAAGFQAPPSQVSHASK